MAPSREEREERAHDHCPLVALNTWRTHLYILLKALLHSSMHTHMGMGADRELVVQGEPRYCKIIW